MERIHIIIGLIIFFIISITASGDEVLTRDERIVALTILGEARGEGKKGMYAVACVIQKRASERNLTPAKVCHQPYQFSIWNAGKGKIKKESELYYLWKSPSMMYARELARFIYRDDVVLKDVTLNANHFCNINVKPKWGKGRKPTVVIGNHKFYYLPFLKKKLDKTDKNEVR